MAGYMLALSVQIGIRFPGHRRSRRIVGAGIQISKYAFALTHHNDLVAKAGDRETPCIPIRQIIHMAKTLPGNCARRTQ